MSRFPPGARMKRMPAPLPPQQAVAAYFTALDYEDYARAESLAQTFPGLLLVQDDKGSTAAMRLYEAEQWVRFETCVEMGAELNATDSDGFALIHDVIARDDLDTMKLLGRHGLDFSVPTGQGLLPASLGLALNAIECLGYLVDCDADLVTPGHEGFSVATAFERYDLPASLKTRIRAKLQRR